MNFLTSYLHYSESNGAPTLYHEWSGLAVLSHVIGPRIWTHMGGSLTFYPNMYIMLVGEPGMRKSTAMRQAAKLIEGHKIVIAPSSASKEALVQMLAKDGSPCIRSYSFEGKLIKYAQLSVCANEIVSLLNASGNALGMVEFLTDIWDKTGEVFHELFKNKGENTVVNPYPDILACLTPDTMKSLVTSKVIGSGMSRRCLFVTAKRNGRPNAFIEVSLAQQQALDYCREHLKKLPLVIGPFSWTDEARAFYKEWYDKFEVAIPDTQSLILRTFYMGKPEYVIKVSMLLALAQEPIERIHTLETFSTALSLVTAIEKGACELFENAGRNELASILPDVENMIRKAGAESVKLGAIKARFWKELKGGNLQELDSILEHLLEQGKISVKETMSTGKVFTWLSKD